ncbi:hypothetical protein EDD86DRAFT_248890 [Gorgonomyces haynaldii]|nr:hypothetical protein EDD86DRAFT_248890 [Gorgonomyces haynaldii]
MILSSGGGAKFKYPTWVWSYTGGWWPAPKHWVRNSIITGGIVAGIAAYGFSYRHRYPDQWIPSMLWSREFHDPQAVKYWKEQLKKEGREWIEPIPQWWPFKN